VNAGPSTRKQGELFPRIIGHIPLTRRMSEEVDLVYVTPGKQREWT